MSTKTYYFVVTGNYPFPLDMLRYDGCYPDRGEDAAAIGASLDAAFLRNRRITGDPIKVRLCHCAPGHWSPTFDRWVSFGWSVDRESIIRSA